MLLSLSQQEFDTFLSMFIYFWNWLDSFVLVTLPFGSFSFLDLLIGSTVAELFLYITFRLAGGRLGGDD